jgi:hypothetical protein
MLTGESGGQHGYYGHRKTTGHLHIPGKFVATNFIIGAAPSSGARKNCSVTIPIELIYGVSGDDICDVGD